MAESDEVGDGSGGDRKNGTIERSLRSKNLNGATGYLTPNARRAFTQLRQAFTKALILQYFDTQCQIRIETDKSGYAIGSVLNQRTDLGQWHLMAYYSRKMILAKTRYKTHNSQLLAIVEAFKTWQHYLKDCKHKVLVLINHNNLFCFMETKNLSFRQVQWAKELLQYYFWIDYCQSKANRSANALSQFSQRSDDKKKKLWAENSQIVHWLQSSLTNASLSGLGLWRLNASASLNLLPLHQVLICGTHGLPQLYQFWGTLHLELANKGPYKASIGNMRLRLQEL